MKYTVLELTQRILESMEDDEINSISDTPSGTQVANIIKENFYSITGRADLPEHFDFFELTPSGDPLKPTLMTVPTNVLHLDWVKYQDTSAENAPFNVVRYREMDDFLTNMYQLDQGSASVGSYDLVTNNENFVIIYNNDVAPKFYTTFNDETLIFDSYNASEDTTLTKSKTMAYGQLAPSFVLEDSFVPDLDAKQFQLLLQTSKAQAFEEMKQTQFQDARMKERRGWNSLQRQKRKVQRRNELDALPNYGRKR